MDTAHHVFAGLSTLSFLMLYLYYLRFLPATSKNGVVVFASKQHLFLTVFTLVFSLIHGILIGKADGHITGKIVWFALLIYSLTSFLTKKNKTWLKLHKIFSLLLLLLMLVHVILSVLAQTL